MIKYRVREKDFVTTAETEQEKRDCEFTREKKNKEYTFESGSTICEKYWNAQMNEKLIYGVPNPIDRRRGANIHVLVERNRVEANAIRLIRLPHATNSIASTWLNG